MSRPKASSVLCALACVVFLVGVIASALSISRYGTVQQHLAKAVRASGQLDDLEQRFAALDAVVEPFDRLRYDNLIDPEVLMNSAFGNDHVEDVQRDTKTCNDAYVVKLTEVRLKHVALSNLLATVRMAESLRPPLRLTGCKIHASATEAGHGDAVLKLERIEQRVE